MSISGLLVIAALVAGCSQQRPERNAVAIEPGHEAIAVSDVETQPEEEENVERQLTSVVLDTPVPGRKLVRTGQIRFEVSDVYQSALLIENAAVVEGGFVEQSNIRSDIQQVRSLHSTQEGERLEISEYVLTGQLTLRMPSNRTQAFLHAIKDTVVFLDHRDLQATDIQFDWLQQELNRKRSAETQERLAALMEQSARSGDRRTAAEAAAQFAEARDRAQIEQMRLDDKVDFSTIHLNIYQQGKLRTVRRVDLTQAIHRQGPGFFERLGYSLKRGWSGLLDAVLLASTLWPLWLILAAPVIIVLVLIRRCRRRRAEARKTKASTATTGETAQH